MAGQVSRKEIYTYQAPWTAYSMSWCNSTDERNKFKIAVGSYKEEYSNHLSIIQLQSKQTNKGGTSPTSTRCTLHGLRTEILDVALFSCRYILFLRACFNLPYLHPHPHPRNSQTAKW